MQEEAGGRRRAMAELGSSEQTAKERSNYSTELR